MTDQPNQTYSIYYKKGVSFILKGKKKEEGRRKRERPRTTDGLYVKRHKKGCADDVMKLRENRI